MYRSAVRLLLSIPIVGPVLNVTLLSLPSVVRCLAGKWAATGGDGTGFTQPRKPLVLYEFEGCPYCRLVRETVSVLGLDVDVRPCPRTTFKKNYDASSESRYRGEAKRIGGKAQFPFLVDANTGIKMYESGAISEYLWETYGKGTSKPLTYRMPRLLGRQWNVFLSFLSTMIRSLGGGEGLMRRPSRLPAKQLVLYGEEISPFVRVVKERLSSLELPYRFKTMPQDGRGVAKRKAFTKKYDRYLSAWRKKAGLIQIPLLVDPNTKGGEDLIMFESSDIVAYLEEMYAV